MTFEELIQPLTGLSTHERKQLRLAYDLAERAHEGQKRKSGEAYFIHCVEVARLLIDLGMDHAVIAAALLHDVVEDTDITLEDLERELGKEVANLVWGVTKIDRVSLDTEHRPKGKPRDREAEYLRKTLLAIDEDIRVIMIKLADRLHNMRTLSYLSQERQQRMARETMEIFAPLASRLGIWQMKWELEDLSFRYLNPEKYRQIAEKIAERRDDRDKYVVKLVAKLKKLVAEAGIQCEITGRSKHIYSIWRKMERKQLPFEQVFDVRAIRVLVSSIPECYQVLGIVHNAWRPVSNEFDDYIAAPKDNFYQSLHTAVYLEDGKTLEVQIRTTDMHAHAEYGVAAHWRYKELGTSKSAREDAFERRLQYLREMMEVGKDADSAVDFLDTMRSDVFQDRVYVFTPNGDIIDLPAGATPIDFAYHIHTSVGHRCRGAKVNDKLVPLDHTLTVGDRVAVITAKRGGPSRDWLNPNLGYVKTKRAQSKIRHWFRHQDKDKMIVLGRDLLERELKRLGLEKKMGHDQVAELFDRKIDDLYSQIGFGDVHPQHIATRILDMEQKRIEQEKAEEAERQARQMGIPAEKGTRKRQSSTGIQIQGTGGLLTHLARCCNPLMGDEIIGYITVGRGVTIHRTDCKSVLRLPEARLIAVSWGEEADSSYPVPVIINAYDREGLMRDIGAAVAEERINMIELHIKTNANNIAVFHLTMEVQSAVQLNRILAKIERLPNVMEARRLT